MGFSLARVITSVPSEDIVGQILDVGQFGRTEARVVGGEEKIDITVQPGLVADHGAEQAEPANADLMKIGFVGAKLRNCIVPSHDKPPEAQLARAVFEPATSIQGVGTSQLPEPACTPECPPPRA